jgi:uncharacterized protein (TIGR02246 family)
MRTRKVNWRTTLAAAGCVFGLAVATNAAPATAAGADPRPSAATSRSHASDLAQIDRQRQIQEEAWAEGDAAKYATIFTDDADFVTFNGDHMATKREIVEGMQYYFDTYLANTRLLQYDERIRFPRRDLAIIVRTGCVLWNDETTCSEDALSVNTNVAVKRHGRWLFETFQNTRIRPLR